MCYVLRQQQPEGERGYTPATPDADRIRPRWIGAAAGTLVAGLAAAAALIVPPSPPAVAKVQPPAAAVAAKAGTAPAGPVVDARTMLVDDDVPTAPGSSKAAVGHCHEGL